uniref:Uncharacterized protein n=1 Tax=Chenopodium quinoa TaxID=63459 RepID=A0A803LQJ4_CHEQI
MRVELKVGIEVERRDNDGYFTKEAIVKAVSSVMEPESEVGREIRANHAKWREFLLKEGLEDSYTNSFLQSLQDLLG